MKRKSGIIKAGILAAMVSVAVSATAKDQPFYDAHHAQDLVEGNFHVGCGLSSIVNNYATVIDGITDFLQSPGCAMRAGLDVRFNIRNSFGIGTGLEGGINNSRFAMSIVNGNTGTISSAYISHHFYDINVPLYLSWRFNIGSRMQWNLDVGTYFSYGLGGTMKARGYNTGHNSIGQPVVNHVSYSNGYFDADRPYINGVKREDYGPRIATGLVYKNRFSFNVVYQVGLRNLSINPGAIDVKYRNMSLIFQIGYTLF